MKTKRRTNRKIKRNTRRYNARKRGGTKPLALGKPPGTSLNGSPGSSMTKVEFANNYTNFDPLTGINTTKYAVIPLETDETGILAYEGDIGNLFHVYPRLAIQQLADMQEPELSESLTQLGYEDTSKLEKNIRELKDNDTIRDEIYKEYERIVYKQLKQGQILIVDYDLVSGERFVERKLVVKNGDPNIHYYTFAEFKAREDEDDDVQDPRAPSATEVSSSSPIQVNSLARRTLKKGYNYKYGKKDGEGYAYEKKGAFVPLDDKDNLLRQISQGPGLLFSTYENAKHYRTIYRYKKKYGKKYLIHLFLIDPKSVFEILLMYYRDNRGLYDRELEILQEEFIDIKIMVGDSKKGMDVALKTDVLSYIGYSGYKDRDSIASKKYIETKYEDIVAQLKARNTTTL